MFRSRFSFVASLVVLAIEGNARAQSTRETDPAAHRQTETTFGQVDSTPKASSVSHRTIDVTASTEVGEYSDSDHVHVLTPTIAGTFSNPLAGWRASGRYLVDVVSAASADVVSTASPPFTEIRHAGVLDGSYKPGAFGVAATAALSIEPDYTSILGGANVTYDLFDKNLTLLLGYSHLHDIAGRSGTPFSVFSHTLDRDAIKGGATILVDRSTLLSIVADVMIEYGDPSKPYRYVPMFAPGVTVPRGASIAEVTRLRLPERVLEQLPLERDRWALSMGWAHRFQKSTLRFDARGYADTWGLKATTTDSRWLFDLSRRFNVGPHLRFYGQTPVDFWQRAYVLSQTNVFPVIRTGNRELGPLVNLTGGASARFYLGSSADPRTWVLGLDVNVTSTHYLDDIYLTQRWSIVSGLTLEVAL